MNYQNIPLKSKTINKTVIFEPCKCEFCGQKIQFIYYTGWLGNEASAYDAPFKSIQESTPHYCKKRPTRWAKIDDIPEGWEIDRSDDDDDYAAFIGKEMTVFDK